LGVQNLKFSNILNTEGRQVFRVALQCRHF